MQILENENYFSIKNIFFSSFPHDIESTQWHWKSIHSPQANSRHISGHFMKKVGRVSQWLSLQFNKQLTFSSHHIRRWFLFILYQAR